MLESSRPPVVLDVRWQLGDTDGHKKYRDGHLPGAVYVDLDGELAGPPSIAAGRHPLPDLTELQAAARRWGIDDDVPVVVYDDCGGMSAARAWWLLRWGGLTDVRILDGGLEVWRQAGLRLSRGSTEPRGGNVVLSGGGMPTATIDDVADTTALLLDARAGERYRGETEPIDPRAGHIPGAVSAPTGENLTVTGSFQPADVLRERFTGLGADRDVIVYCGSGVTAAHEIAALQIAGFDGAALYPGSYSQWSNTARPVELG
ncbi:MAG: sulfurtransferase [Gordonia sp. (in: high G+C Gram-positive bacteria)]|uniref:sulfurtransferase n=1 Tax=Gordonia sp. (in: high G+C Gram-positive bacteria) TaxID=84139 RepID=UPI003BB4A150